MKQRVNRTLSGVGERIPGSRAGEAKGTASRWHRLCDVAGPPTGRREWGLRNQREMKGRNPEL